MASNNSEDTWKQKLSSEEYRVLREKGTEAPFSGKYENHYEKGEYSCKACGQKLFDSKTKYESKLDGLRGWPSFEDAIPGSVEFVSDNSHGMKRVEVICSKCKSHLGHVFEGDPHAKTGKHYCINSVCLDFEKKK